MPNGATPGVRYAAPMLTDVSRADAGPAGPLAVIPAAVRFGAAMLGTVGG